MDQTVAHDNQISGRQAICYEVQHLETPETALHAPVALDKLHYNVASDVSDVIGQAGRYPVRIAARNVEDRPNAEFRDEAGESRTDICGRRHGRAGAGNGFRPIPIVSGKDFA